MGQKEGKGSKGSRAEKEEEMGKKGRKKGKGKGRVDREGKVEKGGEDKSAVNAPNLKSWIRPSCWPPNIQQRKYVNHAELKSDNYMYLLGHSFKHVVLYEYFTFGFSTHILASWW